MERPIDIIEQGIYIEPNVFSNDSEYELFHSYLDAQKYIKWLESELKKLRVDDVSFECTHENTEFKHIRCNVCTDCGELVEIDV